MEQFDLSISITDEKVLVTIPTRERDYKFSTYHNGQKPGAMTLARFIATLLDTSLDYTSALGKEKAHHLEANFDRPDTVLVDDDWPYDIQEAGGTITVWCVRMYGDDVQKQYNIPQKLQHLSGILTKIKRALTPTRPREEIIASIDESLEVVTRAVDEIKVTR